MPALSAVYGLKEDDVLRMPYATLKEYVDQLEHWASVLSSGASSPSNGGSR